ncbi:MAG: hypothetical protein U0527_17435 [Candidatus Eisenbacteria bacterium]
MPEGSTVYLAADYDPGSMPELQPMLETAIRQLRRRNVKIVAGSLWPACPPLVDGAFRRIAAGEFGKKDGVDYVNLGFKEGREVVMVQLGDDIRRAYPTDAQGRALDTLPIMQNIRRLGDMPLMVNISAGYPGTKEWVQQVRNRYNVPMVSGCTAVSTPEYFSYYQSKQLSGLLGGLAGAAEFEKLSGQSGTATRGMDAQSLGHLAIILFILGGNIVFFLRKREGLA